MCFAPQRRALFRNLNFQKCSDHGVFLYILTWKCASRHDGVHFFVISTSKTAPNPSIFNFQICFAPQRRALFQHLNFQKWSDTEVFCTFSLRKSASRHNGVQLFISHLPRCLRTRRFSEPTFRPSGAPNHWENTVFRGLPYLFMHLHLLSSYSFSSTLLSSNLSLLSASSLLCFSSVHIVGSLTSKLPSIMSQCVLFKKVQERNFQVTDK